MGRVVIFKDVMFWYWIMKVVNVCKIWRTHQTNIFKMTSVLYQKTIHTITVFHKQKLPMAFNGTEHRNFVDSVWDSTLQLTFFKSTICQEICYSIKNIDTAISITWMQFQSDAYDHEIKWSIHLLLLCSSLNSFLWTISWHSEMLAFSKADLHFY